MKITDMKVIIGLCLTLLGAGYAAANTFATADSVKVASTKAEMALDITIESLMAKLALLESKPNKTAYDIARITFLQNEIARLRALRSL